MLRLLVVACLCELYTLSLAAVIGSESDNLVVLENGYTKVSYDKRFGVISSIESDFSGSSNYSSNLLSDSFGLEVQRSKNNCLQKIKPIPTVEWIERSARTHKVKISNVLDCSFSPVISETWTIALTSSQRSFDVSVDGVVLQGNNFSAVSDMNYLLSRR